MAYNNPTVADFQAQFVRDFRYGTDINNSVTDQDIANAYNMVNAFALTSRLFANQAAYSLGYLLLAAHYLTENIRMAGQGIYGQYNFLQASKGAGGVNEAFSIPQRILDNPLFSMLAKTNYGKQFLQQVMPQLQGAMFTAYGPTKP